MGFVMHLYTVVEVYFLRITWINGIKFRRFLVVLSLTSDAWFLRVSVMSDVGRGINPSMSLRFEPVFTYC
jgi:hypothetical protein